MIKQLYDEILASQPLQNPAGELRRLRLEREHIQRRVGCTFSAISRFLERILMEHIESKNSVESKLQINSICSIRIQSRNQDIVKKP